MFNPKNLPFVLTAYCILITSFANSKEYRTSGFTKPMNLPFNLAGSFGEPRKDHFHSGIDIKTNGVEGVPVFAIGDGYISRIKVSPYGYGKAIYITHPNGFTSVCGHLSGFYGAIEKYIHQQHYLQKKSELDLTLNASVFPLKQNDTIAFSGNTGGSSAPHLHFEIRDSKTEHALNPLDFYPKDFYVDTIPPQINKVKVREVFLNHYFSGDTVSFLKNNINHLTSDTIIISGTSRFCLSLEGFDKQDHSENKNGIQKIEVFQNDSLAFKYDLNEIDFEKTRMCNAFIDYHEMMNDNGYFYNCYQLNGNSLTMYSSANKGYFEINNKEKTDLTIFCHDYNGNKTKIDLTVLRNDRILSQDSATLIVCPIFRAIFKNEFHINFPTNSLYEDIFMEIDEQKTGSKKYLSEKYTVSPFNKELYPLQKPAKIEMNSTVKKNRNKIVMVRQDNKEKETALKTTFDKTKFYADTKELGAFYLKYDTTKPEINIIHLKSEIINVSISDNLSGIDTYNGYIDDQWVNFYYDAKNDYLQYDFDEKCPKGEHLLKIVVTDKVGNKTIVQQKFNY